MARSLDPRLSVEPSGPKHGFAMPEPVSDLDIGSNSGPEISAMEHAIRMAPAGWDFESDEPETSR